MNSDEVTAQLVGGTNSAGGARIGANNIERGASCSLNPTRGSLYDVVG